MSEISDFLNIIPSLIFLEHLFIDMRKQGKEYEDYKVTPRKEKIPINRLHMHQKEAHLC